MPTEPVYRLRPVNGTASLLAEYGAALPASVEDARLLFHRLRRESPGAPDMHAIGALALDSTPKAAAKALTETRVAAEVHAAALEVAASRAVAALYAASDEMVEAVLASPALAEAVAEIADVARTVNPSVPHTPAPGTPEADVIAAARLRRAEAVLARAATSLDVALGVHFDPLPLLWLDPTDVEDWKAFSNALRGIRYGVLYIPMQVTHSGSPVGVPDNTAHGIPSASAAGVAGVRFSLAKSFADFEARAALVARRGVAAPTSPVMVEESPGRITVL